MTSELTALTLSALLCALLALPYGFPQTSVWGLRVAMGNRENPPPLPEWANRAVRAHRNMLENLPHFSVFVIVAILAESTDLGGPQTDPRLEGPQGIDRSMSEGDPGIEQKECERCT